MEVSCRRRRWTEGSGSMQRCILIGAGDCSVQKIETKPEDLVIAVDGGYDTCRKYDIVPDLIVGDFDSAQESDMPQIAELSLIHI